MLQCLAYDATAYWYPCNKHANAAVLIATAEQPTCTCRLKSTCRQARSVEHATFIEACMLRTAALDRHAAMYTSYSCIVTTEPYWFLYWRAIPLCGAAMQPPDSQRSIHCQQVWSSVHQSRVLYANIYVIYAPVTVQWWIHTVILKQLNNMCTN